MADKGTKKNIPKRDGKRRMRGVVVKRSGEMTVSVETERTITHPVYRKKLKRTKKFLAHDPSNEIAVGTEVVIRESRPMSARKRWVVEGIGSKKKK